VLGEYCRIVIAHWLATVSGPELAWHGVLPLETGISEGDTIYVVRGAQNEVPAITPEALSRVDNQEDASASSDPMGGLMEIPFMKVSSQRLAIHYPFILD
jgi:hypothetical protein